MLTLGIKSRVEVLNEVINWQMKALAETHCPTGLEILDRVKGAELTGCVAQFKPRGCIKRIPQRNREVIHRERVDGPAQLKSIRHIPHPPEIAREHRPICRHRAQKDARRTNMTAVGRANKVRCDERVHQFRIR